MQQPLLALVQQLAQKASTTPQGKAQADQLLGLVRDVTSNRLNPQEAKERLLQLK
jgi:hypothetical protein